MKRVCVIAMLSGMFLTGCGSSKLDKCRQENDNLQSNVKLLQQELLAAKEAVAKKDKMIQDLQSENTQLQTKAMESIKTMMEKQTAKDQETKDKLQLVQKQLEQVKVERDQALQKLNTPAPAPQPAPVQ